VATIVSIISWLVFGLIVGAIARLLLPGKQAMGWMMTAVMGIIGSVVGGAISWALFGTPDGNINPAGWLMSIVGAVVVVAVYGRLATARRTG